MNTILSKEEVLVEALPYIQRYEGKTFVIKYGGAAMTDGALKESFAKDVILLRKIGINIIIVHGGGKAISELSVKLGHEVRFHNGQRYTDAETLSSVMMTLAGTTNKEIVSLINRNNGSAVGLSGLDGNLLSASKLLPDGVDLGSVGTVSTVNTKFIEMLLSHGSIPVIAPVAADAGGECYNINGDIAASAIAAAMRAEKLFFMTDTNGILQDGELLPTLTADKARQCIAHGTITDGMIPKVHAAITALEDGVHKVHIINGAQKHSLLLEIFTNIGAGTQIIRSERHVLTSNTNSNGKEDHLGFSTLTYDRLFELFALADQLRRHPEIRPLTGKSIALLFQKPSLRTRVSFEVGIAELGGTPVVLGDESIGIGKRESVYDVAKTLSRYCDGIIARVFEHTLLEELAGHTTVPVVNALSDLLHPCQILADAYTIYKKGKLKPGMKVVFIGDGNNVANSWLELASIFPMHLVLAVPPGYEPDTSIHSKALSAGISRIEILGDPLEAAQNAHVLYTDVWTSVWTSMGQESERRERNAIFASYRIDEALLALASPECIIMHCLPAHRGEEITDAMICSSQSVIFEQAENRLHIQKALLAMLLGEGAAASDAITLYDHEKNSEAVSH